MNNFEISNSLMLNNSKKYLLKDKKMVIQMINKLKKNAFILITKIKKKILSCSEFSNSYFAINID
jgi:hypothetical protein